MAGALTAGSRLERSIAILSGGNVDPGLYASIVGG